MDPKTSLPLAVQRHEPGPARRRYVAVVKEMQLNPKIQANLPRVIDETSPDWKIISESVPKITQAQ
jgi:hypothetical protein